MGGGPVFPADLQATVPELLSRMLAAADQDDWLNAYLLAVGAVQIVEDRLQGSSQLARRLLDHVGGDDRGPAARAVLRSARAGLDAATELALSAPTRRRLRRWCGHLSEVTERLADLVIAPGGPAAGAAAEGLRRDLRTAVSWIRGQTGAHRLLAGAVLKHPSCFGSFDQHPDDVAALARRFRDRRPDRDRPLLVVGVRTSGSYLAPLAGAALRRLGYRDVVVGTTRPGNALLAGRDAMVRRIRARRGFVLILDDPPITGGSLASVARRAEREGFPADAVVPLVATFDDSGTVPTILDRYQSVLLPGRAWHVRDRLRPDALEPLVAGALRPGEQLIRITVGAQGSLSRWAHLAVPVTVGIEADGRARTLPMVAEWTGVGYFGERSVAVACALGGLVPTVYGFADGVLLRERAPGEEEGAPEAVVGAEEVAHYVATRQTVLAVPDDRSRHLAGRQPVWEIAARILAPAFGRPGAVLRPPLVEPLTKAVLAPEHPCVIDGRATAGRWKADGRGGWVKTDYAEGAFSHLDLASYDAAFDLARAAMSASIDEQELLASYQGLSGSRVDPARWCLLKLVHAWDQERLAADEPDHGAKARAVQQFLAGTYLGGIEAEARGDWCVLDIDGVLETDVVGFPASSPLGMLSLRALKAHGYRVLLASGRPLPDIEDRCAAYGLSGGVAEYGCVSYVADTRDAQVHIPPGSWDAGYPALVGRLSSAPTVRVDPLYRWCVRASIGQGAGRTALPDKMLRELRNDPEIADSFLVVQGDAQTDFVPRGVDKARGVQGLLARFGEKEAVPALAVGDGAPDVPLLLWAEHGFAPRNAQPAVEAAGVPVLGRAYQAGLAEAVHRLIGHRPGGCAACAPPPQDAATRALAGLLAVPEAGRAGAPLRIAGLAWETFRVCSRERPWAGRFGDVRW